MSVCVQVGVSPHISKRAVAMVVFQICIVEAHINDKRRGGRGTRPSQPYGRVALPKHTRTRRLYPAVPPPTPKRSSNSCTGSRSASAATLARLLVLTSSSLPLLSLISVDRSVLGFRWTRTSPSCWARQMESRAGKDGRSIDGWFETICVNEPSCSSLSISTHPQNR